MDECSLNAGECSLNAYESSLSAGDCSLSTQFWSEEEELYARQQMMNDGYYEEQGSPHDRTGYSDEHYI
jgi:hypothetical protein